MKIISERFFFGLKDQGTSDEYFDPYGKQLFIIIYYLSKIIC